MTLASTLLQRKLQKSFSEMLCSYLFDDVILKLTQSGVNANGGNRTWRVEGNELCFHSDISLLTSLNKIK